jgi:hypothetical protein
MPTTVKKPFNPSDTLVTLENGSKIRINKWSVRKAMVMGTSLAKVIGSVFSLIESKSDKGEIQISDIVSLIPQVLESCADELTYIIVESTTLPDGTEQVSKDDVLDKLSIDDFVDLLSSIIEANLTDKTMGKWKRLLRATPLVGAN